MGETSPRSTARKNFIKSFKAGAHALNDTVHQPYLYDLTWYTLYGLLFSIGAPFVLLGLLIMFIRDIFLGKFFTNSYIDADGRVVVVTGCDSGFGLEISKLLVERGYKVYAGCLTEAGVKQLEGVSKMLVPVRLNVLKQEDIEAAMKKIGAENPQGLYCVINNAGVGIGAPLDWVEMNHYDLVMGVNFFGMVRMCKTALPLLKKSVANDRGARIVNVTSIAGVFGGMPVMTAYTSSKHAAEAFSRCLRAELECLGINVSILNPTFHNTAMADSAGQFKSVWNSVSPEKQKEYGEQYLNEMLRIAHEGQAFAWNKENVIRMMYHAVAGTRPRDSYMIGLDGLCLLGPLIMTPSRFQYAFMYALGRWGRFKPAYRAQQIKPAQKEVSSDKPAATTQGGQ